MDFLRQTDIFNPVNQRFKIKIMGAGGLGSFIALNLAKLGFSEITVYDFDVVEAHNVPNQFYRTKDIGKYKVEALKRIIKDFTGVNITVRNEEITKDSKIIVNIDDVFILTFDTLEARKIFLGLVKDYKCEILDVRVGGEEYSIQVINTYKEDELKLWKNSFDIVPAELPCSAKSIIYTNLSVTSEVCNIVKKMNNREIYPRKVIRHMRDYLILNDLKK